MSNNNGNRTEIELAAGDAGITIREAGAEDRGALERLAQLDSSRLPEGPMVVAEIEGELQAAHSINERRTISNPFRPTAELVALVELHARHVNGKSRGRGRRSAAPQPPGLGIAFLPPRVGRRAV